ncbi:MAG TPA: hypothetical protein VIU62_01000 [Chloroflexota bacterium]
MKLLSGSYTGDGTTGRVFSGFSFQPVAVIIKARTGAHDGQICLSSMGADQTKDISAGTSAGLTSGLVTSLDSDGFTLGSNANVNGAGVVYNWLALGDDGAGDLHVGTYTGTGASLAITGVGFQANAVIIADGDASTRCQWGSSDMPSGHVSNFGAVADATTTGVTSLDSDGFTLGANLGVNANTHTYYYLAIQSVASKFKTLTYTGNAVDNRSITGAGFQPDNVITKDGGQTAAAAFRGRTDSGDSSSQLDTTNNSVNLIQALESDGFQIGTASGVNSNTFTYYAMVFKDSVTGDVPLYTPFLVFTREHDPAKDAPTTAYYFEAFLKAPGGQNCYARLYNVTDGAPVAGSAISTSATAATRVRSGAITLASGSKVYRAEFGGNGGTGVFTCYGADIIADVTG